MSVFEVEEARELSDMSTRASCVSLRTSTVKSLTTSVSSSGIDLFELATAMAPPDRLLNRFLEMNTNPGPA